MASEFVAAMECIAETVNRLNRLTDLVVDIERRLAALESRDSVAEQTAAKVIEGLPKLRERFGAAVKQGASA